MGEERPQAKKSELEQKYEAALDTIAGGKSWETIVAKSVLDKKSRPIDRFFAYLKNNLAAIASLTVAISGISFGILQYKTGQWQKEREIKIAKVEALEKLLPSLTSENPNARRYALSALFTLYSDDSASTDNKEFLALLEQIGEVGDAETVDAIARKLNNNTKLKKRAAELYAIRAEQNRHNAADAEEPADQKQENFYKARKYNDAAWEDVEKALAIDPENAKAIYQLGRLLMDTRQDFSSASEKFRQVIKLIEDSKYPRDNEIYLGSYLNQLHCLYKRDKKVITSAVCQAYRVTKTKYEESGVGELDIKGEGLEEFEAACR